MSSSKVMAMHLPILPDLNSVREDLIPHSTEEVVLKSLPRSDQRFPDDEELAEAPGGSLISRNARYGPTVPARRPTLSLDLAQDEAMESAATLDIEQTAAGAVPVKQLDLASAPWSNCATQACMKIATATLSMCAQPATVAGRFHAYDRLRRKHSRFPGQPRSVSTRSNFQPAEGQIKPTLGTRVQMMMHWGLGIVLALVG